MCRKALFVGVFVLALGVPSLRADAMGFISCDPVGSASVSLPGATGASLGCGGPSDFAQGAVEINVSPDLTPFGSVSGQLTIPGACDLSLVIPPDIWPPECPLPYRGENPNVSVYFETAVTATGYTEGPPRPGYLVWEVAYDPNLELLAEVPSALFVFEYPIGLPGVRANVGPYSIQAAGTTGSCTGDGPDGYWSCYFGFAMPFELGVPFELSYSLTGYAWASTYPQTVTFDGQFPNMRLRFLEVGDVIPLPGTEHLYTAPGATSVPAHLVPEPSTLSLLGISLLFACSAAHRKRFRRPSR